MLRTWLLVLAFVVVVVSAVAALVVSSREPVPAPERPTTTTPATTAATTPAAAPPPRYEADRVVVEGTGVAQLQGADVAQARRTAERAAKLDALRHLTAAVGALATADGRRLDVVAEAAVLQGISQGFKVIDTRYYSDGSVDVVAALAYDAIDAGAGVRVRRPQ